MQKWERKRGGEKKRGEEREREKKRGGKVFQTMRSSRIHTSRYAADNKSYECSTISGELALIEISTGFKDNE